MTSMTSNGSLHSIFQKKFKIMIYGKNYHYFTSPNPASFLKEKLSLLVICLHVLRMDLAHKFGTCTMNIFILLRFLMKNQDYPHLLKFYLSRSCKGLNNSQLYRFYHMNILNCDMFYLEWFIIAKSWHFYSDISFETSCRTGVNNIYY